MDTILEQIPIMLLIFVRVVSFFVVVPIFSYRTIPNSFKIGFALCLAFIIYWSIQDVIVPADVIENYLLLVIKEALAGLAIGLLGFIILSAIQIAGGFIDFQMGLALANVMDPQTGAQSPIMGQYLYMFSILFLLVTDGHHLLIDAIYYSYQFIPLTSTGLAFGSESTIAMIAKAFAAMFAIAFQIAIPIVGSIFLIDLALGIVARTVPQLNIFVVGFPVKIFSAYLLLLVVIGTMILTIGKLFEFMLYAMRDFMKLLGMS